jgi:hypothetical protein
VRLGKKLNWFARLARLFAQPEKQLAVQLAAQLAAQLAGILIEMKFAEFLAGIPIGDKNRVRYRRERKF